MGRSSADTNRTYLDSCSITQHDQRSPERRTDPQLTTLPDFALRFDFFPGGYTGEVTPVPIPNTEVKLSKANGTAGASLWESRTLPGF